MIKLKFKYNFKEQYMFIEKRYVKLSVCKSNINKNQYYSRVQNEGKITTEELLSLVKKEAPYLDMAMLEAGMEKLISTMINYIEQGFSVEFFELGSFKLSGKGSLKAKEYMNEALNKVFNEKENIGKEFEKDTFEAAEEDYVESNENYVRNAEEIEGSYNKEITQIAKESIKFNVQFSPSRIIKEHVKKCVEPSIIIAKIEKPKIKKVEKVYSSGKTSVIKIRGENLKLVGKETGLFIKVEDRIIKIQKEAVIRNEPKTLVFITDIKLKEGLEYSIGLSTQYAKMGNRQTSIIRRCKKSFRFERIKQISDVG